jgi:hypothetical protein
MSLIFIACVLHCCTQVRSFEKTWSDVDQKALDKGRVFCVDMGQAGLYNIKDEKPPDYEGPTGIKCLTKFRKMKKDEEYFDQQVIPGYETICGRENN